MAQSNVSAIENGRRMPTAETLHRLLTACGYELLAVAGTRVLGFPVPDDGGTSPSASQGDVVDRAPTITADTPMATRVQAIDAVLELAESVARNRR